MTKGRKYAENVYALRDQVMARMADQAGKPFDFTNFRVQFREAAVEQKLFPGQDGYQSSFRAVMRMVSSKLPKMLPKPPTVKELLTGVPATWRKPGAFDIKKAQLPPGDRE